jgi:hypothetical protein
MIAALCLLFSPTFGFASLGAAENSIDADQMRMGARHHVDVTQQYSVHDLQTADGSRVRQYVASNGLVFAVSWHTLYKPELSALLGQSYAGYAGAAQVAARRPGIQRSFRHEAMDLVVQSGSHLNVFSGFAYRRSMVPRGLSLQQIGLE